MTRRGAEMDVRYDGNGRMIVRPVSGRMPRGSVENVTTIKEGPFKRLLDRVVK